jgi:hypothetical protein
MNTTPWLFVALLLSGCAHHPTLPPAAAERLAAASQGAGGPGEPIYQGEVYGRRPGGGPLFRYQRWVRGSDQAFSVKHRDVGDTLDPMEGAVAWCSSVSSPRRRDAGGRPRFPLNQDVLGWIRGSVPIAASSRRATLLAEVNFQAFHRHLCATVTLQDARTPVPPGWSRRLLPSLCLTGCNVSYCHIASTSPLAIQPATPPRPPTRKASRGQPDPPAVPSRSPIHRATPADEPSGPPKAEGLSRTTPARRASARRAVSRRRTKSK